MHGKQNVLSPAGSGFLQCGGGLGSSPPCQLPGHLPLLDGVFGAW